MSKMISCLGFLCAFFILTQGMVHSQNSSSLDRALAEHLSELKETQQMGVMLYVHWLRPNSLATYSEAGLSLHPARIREIKQLVQITLDQGMTPIGAVPTWVFPQGSQVELLPLEKDKFMGTRLNPPVCVPTIGSPEYQRLFGLHSLILSELVREFPEIDVWLVGADSRPLFFDCSGQPLGLTDHLQFIADSAVSQHAAIKSVNEKSSTVLHFLGDQGTLLETREGQIQPKQLQESLILRLGLSGALPFDFLASDIDSNLLADREPEPSILVPSGNQEMLMTSGWNIQELEEFTEETKESDLVAKYDAWKSFRTDEDFILLTDIAVDDCVGMPTDCEAILRLEDPNEETTSAALASSDPDDEDTDFIPIENFDSGSGVRNRWTAVTDFFPTVEPTPKGPHVVSMLRVNDRVWPSPLGGTQNDQTRFGAIAFGKITRNAAGCTNGGGTTPLFLAALQLTSDWSDANPPESEGATLLYCFEFDLDDEDFWDNPTKLFRVQIIEQELFSAIIGWNLRWQAEIWDLDTQTLLGQSGWITEHTIKDEDQEIPELNEDSQIAFGIGIGTDGGVDVERTGTAYWVFSRGAQTYGQLRKEKHAMRGWLLTITLLIYVSGSTNLRAQVAKLTDLESFSENHLVVGTSIFDNRGESLFAFGISFKGENDSQPSLATIVLIDSVATVLRNEPPPGETSSGKALVIQFRHPVRRVAFRLGNGSSSTVADISAYTAAAKLLGTIEQNNISQRIGPLVGIETTHPEGISTIVIDYGAEEKAEQVSGMRIDYMEEHSFVRCIPQIGDGEASGRRLQTIIQVQNHGIFAQHSMVLRFFDSEGQPLILSIDGQQSAVFDLELGPEGMKSFQTEGTSEPAVVGYACVEGLYPVSAQAIFRTTNESGMGIREAAIPADTGKNDQTLTVEVDPASGLNTGLALVNRSEGEASVLVTLSEGADPLGGIYETERITIPAKGHVSIFVTELFGSVFEDVEGSFEGSVRITDLEQIVAVAVRTIDGFPVSSLPALSWEP